MKNRIAIAEISRRLADQTENVCLMLLPAGKKHGNAYECGSIHGEPGKTLKVNLAGEHRGNWVDWNGSEHKGDLLDLWSQARGIPLPDALKQAKDYLGIREPVLEEKSYKRPADDMPPISPTGQAMQWLGTQRGIEAQIVSRYRVQTDPKARAIIFPSYSPSGELLNRSYRALEADSSGKKKVWQDKEAAPSLWGWQALSEADYAKREILICEGQIDAMTWAQWGIPALSIPNGSGETWLEFEWANLESFKTIYIAMDQDAAGREIEKKIIPRLGKHRCRIVRYKDKDANEALKRGAGAAEAREWVDKSEFATVPHLVTAEHYLNGTIDQFFPTGEVMGHYIAQTKHDNPEYTFRFRPAELTVWTGVSSHGKSTLLNFAMLQLASQTKRPSLIFTFEMKPEKVLRRVMLASGCTPQAREDVGPMLRQMGHWILFCDRIGKIAKPELFEIMQYAVARYGVAHIAIDSLMRIQGLEEDYPAQNEFVTDLVTFARDTGSHIHLVAHPRKSPGHNAPEAHDIKGSGHIRDNADNVVVVWRNREKEKLLEADPKDQKAKQMPDSRLIIDKDREEGMYRDFALSFDPHTYAYSKWAQP